MKNGSWHFDNVVLLGDAAHTAHFSIGSGTKLAMEDAIVLADELGRHPSVAGRPGRLRGRAASAWSSSTQRAAQVSLEWFEHTERYMHLEPLELAFSLLTRSLRVTHENLRLRDPGFVQKVDRRIAEKAQAQTGVTAIGGEQSVPPPMFTPFKLRDMVVDNRIVVSPMCQYSAVDGTVNDWHLVHLGSRAIGGAGLIITEMTDVSADGRISPGCAGLYDAAHVPAFKRIVDFVHHQSRAKIGVQLAHAGRKGATKRPWRGVNSRWTRAAGR